MTKSVKCVGCCSERSASSEPWKQPTRYMIEPTIRNFAGRFRENSGQRPIMVPKKFCRTVHTGMIRDRKSTRLNSSHVRISYAVFCLKKKKKQVATLSLVIEHSAPGVQYHDAR